MTGSSKANDLTRRRQAALEGGGKELWQRFLADAVMDRLPLHLPLRDTLVNDLRARADMADDPLSRAGMEEAMRRLIAL